MTREEEDRIVEVLLEAAEHPNPVEQGASASLEAYRGLARSRGVSLEHVLRAACREELRSVVTLPPADAPAAVDEYLGDRRVIDP